ncbi:MAG TPA: hypothetical protein VM118_02370 [Acidobacteriota bacterium]|nr:hypothetical protein [Acidobacteriota bacterium]
MSRFSVMSVLVVSAAASVLVVEEVSVLEVELVSAAEKALGLGAV